MTMRAHKMRFLIVDDDDVDREQVVRLLRKQHISAEISEAAGEDAARQLIQRYKFDWVILDVHLPSGNGLDLIETCTSSTANVIVLSGANQISFKKSAIKRGAAACIEKSSLSANTILRAISSGQKR